MFNIFTSLSNSDSQTCPKNTPQQPHLDDHNSHSLADVKDSTLAVPPTTYKSRVPLRLLDTGFSEGHLHTPRRGIGNARSSCNLSPSITRSSAFDLSHNLKEPNDPHPSLHPERAESPPTTSCPSARTKQKGSAASKLVGRQTEQVKPGAGRGRIADWFQGESHPVNVYLLPSPTKDKMDSPGAISTSWVSSPSEIPRKSNSQIPSKPPLVGRFSFFSSKTSSPKSAPEAPDPHDELIDLDINKALFPGGPADPFSPAAFKNLVQNAEGLLFQLQAAYKERTILLREMTVEKETQAEELKGAEARGKYLKLQLDDMAAQTAKQDNVIMDLVDDLAREKQLRREEDDALKRNVMLGKTSRATAVSRCDPGTTEAAEYRRQSAASVVSDSGFESEEESVVDSVFSKSRNLTSNASESSFSASNSPDLYHRPERISIPPQAQKALPQSLSIFQSVVTGTPGGFLRDEPTEACTEDVTSTCSNCHGVGASQAWNMVVDLKEENRILSARLAELEGALDGCLDLVNRLGG